MSNNPIIVLKITIHNKRGLNPTFRKYKFVHSMKGVERTPPFISCVPLTLNGRGILSEHAGDFLERLVWQDKRIRQ